MSEDQTLDEACFTNHDDQCPAIDILTQESLTGSDKLIKLRFTDILARDKTRITVTECYDINSIFRYVFGQIYNNPNKEPITPLRKVLSKAQIDRIRRCYFAQPESQREWKDMEAFHTEMARITEIRNQDELAELNRQYANESESELNPEFDRQSESELELESAFSPRRTNQIIDNLLVSDQNDALFWLYEKYPVIALNPSLARDVLYDTLLWMSNNGLRLDRFTMTELLNQDALDLDYYLREKYGDME